MPGRDPIYDDEALKRLVDRAARGNYDALANAFGHYHGILQATLSNLGCPEHEVSDIIHDAFIRAFNSLRKRKKRGMTPDEFRKWLTKIVQNRFIDVCRRRRTEEKWLAEQQPSEAIEDEDAVSEIPPWFTLAMTKMTSLQQEVAKLLAKGFSSAEITAILGVPSETARQRICTVRRRLEEHYHRWKRENE